MAEREGFEPPVP